MNCSLMIAERQPAGLAAKGEQAKNGESFRGWFSAQSSATDVKSLFCVPFPVSFCFVLQKKMERKVERGFRSECAIDEKDK